MEGRLSGTLLGVAAIPSLPLSCEVRYSTAMPFTYIAMHNGFACVFCALVHQHNSPATAQLSPEAQHCTALASN
jgi:hypothetical protein